MVLADVNYYFIDPPVGTYIIMATCVAIHKTYIVHTCMHALVLFVIIHALLCPSKYHACSVFKGLQSSTTLFITVQASMNHTMKSADTLKIHDDNNERLRVI